jgi:DNA-binding beta-propeller fold protein YncE
MKVGAGVREYEVVENWPTMPEGATWGQVVEIVVDSSDRVYIFHRGDTSPMIFNTAGEYQGTWENAGQWKDIHGVTVASDDDGEYFIVVDRDRHTVSRTTLDGDVVWTIGTPDEPHKDGHPFYRPTDSAVAPNGDIYVTDGYGNARVHQFTSTGEHIRSWGTQGVGQGQFNLPHGVRVIERNGELTVYVCDRQNHRIQLFTPEGEYIRKLTGFKQPVDLVVDVEGVRYVGELQHRVTILDENDMPVTRIGGESKAEPGSFVAPHSVWLDSLGSLYVAEVLEGQRVSKLKRA